MMKDEESPFSAVVRELILEHHRLAEENITFKACADAAR